MFSRFFIERPIFATVISLIIVIAGLVSLKLLPAAQYPSITPVQVTVTAYYPGADSKTVADSVAAPIEAQINGVDNMLYMTSTSSSSGQLTITVYFSFETDPDIAQVQVQNRVSMASPQLPDAVVQNGVSVQKKSSNILMILALYNKDGRYKPEYVANYANVYVLDAIKRINGAGQASILGAADQAMRIWMNPDRMVSLGITTSDVRQSVAYQNALFGIVLAIGMVVDDAIVVVENVERNMTKTIFHHGKPRPGPWRGSGRPGASNSGFRTKVLAVRRSSMN